MTYRSSRIRNGSPWREGSERRLIVKKTGAPRRTVVTISGITRAELIERLAIAPQKIAVIPPGIDPHPAPAPGTAPGTAPDTRHQHQHPAPSTQQSVPANVPLFHRLCSSTAATSPI